MKNYLFKKSTGQPPTGTIIADSKTLSTKQNNAKRSYFFSTLTLAFVLFAGNLWSQIITTNAKVNNTANLNVADTAHTFAISFGITASSTAGTMNIAMPSGIEYVPGSLVVTSGVASFTGPTGPANSPVFTIGALTGPTSISLTYKAKASCAAVATVVGATPLKNNVTISLSGGVTLTHTAMATYNVNYGVLNWGIAATWTNDPFNGGVGSSFLRRGRISNSGNGVISKFYIDAKYNSAGIRLDSVTLAPGIVLATTRIGDSTVVLVNLASFTPAQRTAIAAFSNANGGNMNTDTFFFQNTSAEVLIVNYYHKVLSCTNNAVTYKGHYGDNLAANCLNGTESDKTSNVVIPSGTPDIVSQMLSTSNPAIFRVSTKCQTGLMNGLWINTGNAFAKDFEPVMSYNTSSARSSSIGSNTIDTFNYNFYNASTFTNVSLPLAVVGNINIVATEYGPTYRYGWWKIAANSLTSDPDGAGGLSDLDGDGFYDDLAVGDSFKLKWEVGNFNGDTVSCPSSRIAPYYMHLKSSYQNQCGVNQTPIDANALNPVAIYHSLNNTLLTFGGPSDISNGQTVSIKVNIPDMYGHGNFINIGTTFYTEYRLTLPAGMTISGTPTIKGDAKYGNTLVTPTTVSTVGGVTIIRSQNNVNGMGTLNVDLTLACVGGCPSASNISIPIKIVHIEEGASGCRKPVNIGCGNFDITSHCGCPCPLGFQTLDGTADRSSFGYTNSSMTTRVNASTPGVNTSFLMGGDTLNVKSRGVVSGGTFNNGRFRVYYSDPISGSGNSHIVPAGGTAVIYDISAGTSASVLAPTPTIKYGATTDTIDYDFSSYIGVSPPSLTAFSPGDSLNVNLFFVLRDDANLAAYAPTKIANFRMEHYAIQNDTVRACESYGDSYEYWNSVFVSQYDVNNIEPVGCSNYIDRFYYTYFSSWWVTTGDIWPNEFRPIARVDTMTIDFGRKPEFLGPVKLYYMNDSSSGYTNVGNVYKFFKTGGFPVIGDHQTIGTNGGGNQSYFFRLKNTCEWQGTFITSSRPTGVKYSGNTSYPLQVPSYRTTFNNATRTIQKATLNVQPISSTFVGINSPAVWDVRICNQVSYIAGKPWVAFELPAGVTALSIEDVTSGTAVPMTMKSYGVGKVYAQFTGSLGAASCFTARLKANFTICNNDSLKAITGFDCDTITYNPDLSSCFKWSTSLYLNPANTAFQINKIVEPLAAQQLCTDTLYNLEVLNVNAATATNLKFQVTLPAGSEIVPSSSQASYILQSGGTYLSLPDPVFIGSGVYEYNMSTAPAFLTTLGANGLVGAGSPPNNKFNIRFSIRTNGSCQYVSGSQFKFRMTGDNPCGSKATPFTSTSNLFIINGAPVNPNSFGITMGITDTILSPCNLPGTNVIKIKAVNFGPASTTTAEKIRVVLPTNVSFNVGSYTSIRNSIGAPTVTTVGGQQQLDWTLNAGVVVGDSFVYTIGVTPSSALLCGNVDFDVRTFVSFVTTCVSSATTCSLGSTTGSLLKTVTVKKPLFSITAFTGSSVPNGGSGEIVSASVSVLNSGATRTSPYYVYIYNDQNLNAIKDVSDVLVDSILVSSPHNEGSTISVSKTFNVGPSKACPLIAYIDSGACVCDKAQKLLTNVKLSNALNDTSLCSGKTSVIGASPVVGYTYLWSPSDFLSSSSIGNPIFNASNSTTSPIISDYVLTTSRGGCTSTDTIKLTVNPVPLGLDITASNTCIKSPITLTASSTSSGVTYTWKIDGTLAGSGVSITPTLTAGSHNVEITATLANGCISTFTKAILFYDINIGATPTLSTICSGTSTTLTASSTNATAYSWYKIGTASILGSTVTTTTGNLTDTSMFKVIATNGTCKDSSEVTVNVIKSTLVAKTDTTICPGSSVSLSVPASYGNANWYVLPANTAVGTGVLFSVTPAVTTSYRVVATTSTPVCSAVDTVTVTVKTVTLPVVSGTRTICSGASATYTAAPTGTTPTWTASVGTITAAGVFTAPSVTSTTAAIITYSHVDAGGCTVADTHNITINPLPVVSFTGSYPSMCPTNTKVLSGNPTTGTFSGTGVSGTTFTAPTTAGNYTIIYKVTNTSGCTDSASQILVVNPKATSSAITFSPAIVCIGSTTTASSSVTGTWSVVSGPGTINSSSGLLSTTGSTAIVVRFINPGTASTCPDTITGTITPASLPVANAGRDTAVCSGLPAPIGSAAVAGVTYSWSPASGLSSATASNPSFTSNTAGTYTLTVTTTTTATGCTASDNVVVTVNGLPTANAGPDKSRVNCTGDSAMIGTASVAGMTYAWSPATNLSSTSVAQPYAKPTATTTYVLTITQTSTGCKGTDDVIVNVSNSTLTADAGPDKIACTGVAAQAIGGAPTATSGVPTYTYAWSPATGLSSTSIANPTAATTTVGATNYALLLTDSKGCIARDTVTVTINSLPVANAGTDTAVCSGLPAQIGSTAVAGVTYSWSPTTGLSSATASNPSFTSSTAGTYTFTVTATTSATGCTASDNVVVTVNGLPTANAGPDKSRVNCTGDSAMIGTASVAGMTYAWSPATNLSSTSVAQPYAKPTATTTYVLTITQTSTGCKGTDDVIVNVTNSTLTADAGSDKIACQGVAAQGIGGAPTATSGVPTYTYAWSPATGLSSTSIANPTAATTTVGATNYALLLTDSKGCIARDTVTVTINALPVVNAGTDTAVCSGLPAPIGSTAVAGVTYLWSPNTGLSSATASNPSFTSSTAGTYTFTVTATTTATGCTASDNVVVTVNGLPTANAGPDKSRVNCSGDSVMIGTASVAGMTYAWSPATNLTSTSVAQPYAKPTATTTYILTITQTSTGCKGTDDVIVNVTNSTLTADAGIDKAACKGALAQTIGGTPTAIGGSLPYTYAWSPVTGLSSTSIANPTAATTTVGATNYALLLTDSKGCIARDTVRMTINALPTVSVISSPSSICFGSSSTLSVTAPTAISYNWSPTGSGASHIVTPTSNTTYKVTVTDANLCSDTASVLVSVKGTSLLTASPGASREICLGSSTTIGSILGSTGIGGAGSYTYLWDNGAGTISNPIVSPVSTTRYRVTVTSAGCTAIDSVLVTVNPKPVTAPTAVPSVICFGEDTKINANASGGTGTLTYAWSNGNTVNTFTTTPSSSITYSVTVTDSKGCTAIGSASVTVNPLPISSVTSTSQSLCITNNGGSANILATLSAGETGVWSVLSQPAGSPAVTFGSATSVATSVSNLFPSTTAYVFKWTVTSAAGCISNPSNTASITVNELPVVSAGAKDTICLGASKTLVGTSTSTGNALVSWKAVTLSSSAISTITTVTVTPTVETKYYFTSSIISCSAIDSTLVSIIAKPDLIADMTTCLPATEDVATTYPLTSVSGNDNNSAVIKGGVTYSIISTKHGVTTLSGSTISYKADTNYNGKDTVVIEAYSNICNNLRDTATFCIDVAAVNDAPVAKDDSVKAIGTNPVSFNPLTNDSDIETTLTGSNITVLSGPNKGTISGPDATGKITYTGSTSNFAGLDTIAIQVCDNGLPLPAICDTSFVVIQVVPQVSDSTVNTVPGTSVSIGSPIALGSGVTMSTKLIGTTGTTGSSAITTNSGSATIDPVTGVMTYKPSDTPFIGKDTITKVLCFTYPNGAEACDTSIFVVSNPSVTNINRDTTPMNTPVTFPALKPYKFEGGVATTNSSPTLSIDPVTGAVVYTPKPGYVGIDTAKITRCDNKGNCVTDIFIVNVTPNLPDTSIIASGNTPVNLGPAIVAGPGATVDITVVGPSHGTATKNADGTVTYVPSGSYVGRDTITKIVKVTYPDGTVKYDTQTVLVKNTLPDVTNPDGDIIVKQDETKDIGVLPVVTFEGSPVTTTTTTSAGSTVTIAADGKVTYKPKPGFYGVDTIKIVRCDNLGNCVTSIFIVKVEQVATEIPTLFSPNGDGINDKFDLSALQNKYPNLKLMIYNRWGNVVWRSEGTYTNNWGGEHYDGTNLPDGVYYYLIELTGEFNESRTGFIELMRQ